MSAHPLTAPDTTIDVRSVFGLDVDMTVPAFSEGSDYVPAIDEAYQFDHDTTLAILAGFGHNRRV
ncbi:MAG TPA: cobaltochelatase subunit CobS, partial [Alphaproteobacteria bacterium]|nr:cobaltochelatase subunit CobS [Alphaproteobacteria bacterium]